LNFTLSDEQEQFQQTLARLLARACASQQLHRSIAQPGAFDRGLWRELVAFGLHRIGIPEADGGLGLSMIDLALAAEELGRCAAPVPFLGHALATLAVSTVGTKQQKARWLPALGAGDAIGAVGLHGEGGWLPEGWTLTAGSAVTADVANVPHGASADLLVLGLRGGRLGLVQLDKTVERVSMEGVDLTRPLDLLRLRNAPVEVLGAGRRGGERLCDAALVLLAADAFGGASRCVEMATNYAMEREQFGVTIAHFQAIRHKLANMAVEAEPCRGLYWYAAHAFDHFPARSSHAAALAKAHICERFLKCSRENIEIHGGLGYTWDADPHIWMKRAMFDWSWMGSPRLNRARAADLAGW